MTRSKFDKKKAMRQRERQRREKDSRLTIEVDDEHVDDHHDEYVHRRSPANLHERCRFYGRASPALCHRRSWPCGYSPDYYYDMSLDREQVFAMHEAFHMWLKYTSECRTHARLRVYEEELIAKSCAPHRLEQL
jgi:hypothetical protein